VSKKKVFISHNYEDQAKVHLLKGQLTNSTDIDITFVSEPPVSGSEIQKSINAQIDQSSLMLVMLGENWSRWQEYEVNNALKKSIYFRWRTNCKLELERNIKSSLWRSPHSRLQSSR